MKIGVFCLLLVLKTCQLPAQSPDKKVEQNALTFILNNFERIPLTNFSDFKKAKDGKLYYRIFTDTTNSYKIFTDPTWVKDKMFEADTLNVKETVDYSYDTQNTSHYKPIEVSWKYKEFKQKSVKGDLFFSIGPKVSYKDHYYVKMFVYENGEYTESTILIKLSTEGKVQKIAFEQGIP